MRDKFFHYYRPDNEFFEKLWKEGIFSFDANILLNFYKYSEKTYLKFIKMLNNISGRIFITHQAALEFHRNRLNTISEQQKSYNKILKELEVIKNKVESCFGQFKIHKLLNSKRISSSIQRSITRQMGIVKKAQARHPDYLKEDKTLNDVTEIFKDNVGEKFKNENLDKICNEGEKRFNKSIPPGYKDFKKDGDKKYGDYIIWCQLINFSKKNNKSVIFVSDDLKEDWWHEHNGKKIGPRPELLEEFLEETKNNFYMYDSHSFIRYADKYFNEEVGREILKEIEDIKDNIYYDDSKSLDTYINDRRSFYRLLKMLIKNKDHSEKTKIIRRLIDRNISEKDIKYLNNIRNLISHGDYNLRDMDLLNKSDLLPYIHSIEHYINEDDPDNDEDDE